MTHKYPQYQFQQDPFGGSHATVHVNTKTVTSIGALQRSECTLKKGERPLIDTYYVKESMKTKNLL
jgi:hypothetical protein